VAVATDEVHLSAVVECRDGMTGLVVRDGHVVGVDQSPASVRQRSR
jgi:hypothetical protein